MPILVDDIFRYPEYPDHYPECPDPQVRSFPRSVPNPEYPGLYPESLGRPNKRTKTACMSRGAAASMTFPVRRQEKKCGRKAEEGREGCGEAYPLLDSCGGRPNNGARRVRRSFKRSTMEDVRGELIPAEEWIKRAWEKVENEERKMLVDRRSGGRRWKSMGGRWENKPSSWRKKKERRES